jgi:C-methyltransferase C-terminal domain/Methyltransferase domain/Putative zinc binding domain
MGSVTHCGLCGGGNLTTILDMGEQPLAERPGDGPRFPLALLECADCTLVQLSFIPDQREVFPLDHPYSTGNTKALRDHFALMALELSARLAPGALVVDIGCNDGTLLAAFCNDLHRLGVEPTEQGKKCADRGIPVWQNFFTAHVARGIRETSGPAALVTACNVLAHVPQVHDFIKGVALLLADDGVFVTENHDLLSVTDGLQVDSVYHEHLRYYSVASLSRLLAMHGLAVTRSEQIPTHGGSFRVTARKARTGLKPRAEATMGVLHELLRGLTFNGSAVYGVGATTRATPLIWYARIAPYITRVCEVPGSEKIGTLMPGTSIPVVDEADLIAHQPAYALLLAWHLKDTLVPALRAKGYKGKFIVPLPQPGLLGD